MKKQIRYSLLDPTGNITILAETPVLPALQPAAAARLMEREPSAEQVGFLYTAEDGGYVIRMAGGEFCGNAAMSAAALSAELSGRSEGIIPVRVSGADRPVDVLVSSLPGGGYRCTVTMPRPLSAGAEQAAGAGILCVVRFPGITHVILEQTPDREAAEAEAPALCRRLGADALGMMFLDRTAQTLTPLVYVPAAGTLVWENSCASGTTAAGAYLAAVSGAPLSLPLRQPGGTLRIDAARDGTLSLTGMVKLLRRSDAVIEL